MQISALMKQKLKKLSVFDRKFDELIFYNFMETIYVLVN